MHFARFLSGGFTTMAAINPQEKKLAKRNSVQWGGIVSEAVFSTSYNYVRNFFDFHKVTV